MSEFGPKDVFLLSLSRCERWTDFVDRFYARFLAASPAIREKFAHTDFDRQKRMLRRSLELIASATVGDPDGLRELNDRAETHSRSRLDIRPELYGLWLEAVIETAREFDPAWTLAVESAWRVTLGHGIRHMTHRYQD